MDYDCGRDYEYDKALRELEENTWIGAADCLPDDGVSVLVYVEHDMYGARHYTKRDITIGEMQGGKWKCAQFIGNRVLAWKKLPKPPAIAG